MEKNVMDILTIIPRNEVRTTGIAYVMSILDPEITSEVDKMKWSEFWKYFEKEWLINDEYIATWNIIDEAENYKEL